MPEIVQRFRAARPGIEIELRERSTIEQLRAVQAGVIDVGLVRPPIEDDAELRVETVMRERILAALPVEHPLAALSASPAQTARGRAPFVLFPRAQAPGFHDLLIGSVAATGAPPHVVQYAPEMLTIIGLVAAGIGLSLVPSSVARLALDGVTYRPVSGAPSSRARGHHPRRRRTRSLVRAFVESAAL